MKTILKQMILGLIVLWPGLAGTVPQQASAQQTPLQNDQHQRSLAAIDLAIEAAKAGLIDVSFEAADRLQGSGPVVRQPKFNSLLGQKQNVQNVNSSSLRQAALEEKDKVTKLLELAEAWQEKEADPVRQYEALLSFVLPESNSQLLQTSLANQGMSSISTQWPIPDFPETLADSLVKVAVDGGLVEKLEQAVEENDKNELAATRKLIQMLLLKETDASKEEVKKYLDQFLEEGELYHGQAAADPMIAAACQLANTLPEVEDYVARVAAVVIESPVDPSSSSGTYPTPWQNYIVSWTLRRTIRTNDKEQLEKLLKYNLARFEQYRSGNEDYLNYQQANLLSSCVSLTISEKQPEMFIDCLQQLAFHSGLSGSYSGRGSSFLNYGADSFPNFLQLGTEQRFNVLKEYLWSLPDLGVQDTGTAGLHEILPTFFVEVSKAKGGSDNEWFKSGGYQLLEQHVRDALELGEEDYLAAKLKELEDNKSDNAKVLMIAIAMAKGEPVEAGWLRTTEEEGQEAFVPVGAQVGSFDYRIASYLLQHDSTSEMGRQYAKAMADQPKVGNQNISFRELLESSDAFGELPLSYWKLTHYPYPTRPYNHNLAGSWEAQDEKLIHQPGNSYAYLFFRYPLTGDLEFSVKADISFEKAKGGCVGLELGGAAFAVYEDSQIASIAGRTATLNRIGASTNAGQDVQYRIKRSENSVQFFIEDSEALRTETNNPNDFPFLGFYVQPESDVRYSELKLTGDLTIPREVKMLTPSLAGWCALLESDTVDSPTFSVEQQRPNYPDDYRFDWQIGDEGVLEGSKASSTEVDKKQKLSFEQYSSAGMKEHERLIQYLRPLCDDEKISLEFWYEEGEYSLSPALGRVAILLEDDLPLHWISLDDTGIWSGLDTENANVDPDAEKPGKLELKEGEWNQMTLSLKDGVLELSVNDQLIMRRAWEPEAGRQFGLFHDPQKHGVRVRNIVLKGDWPEKLPENLLEMVATE